MMQDEQFIQDVVGTYIARAIADGKLTIPEGATYRFNLEERQVTPDSLAGEILQGLRVNDVSLHKHGENTSDFGDGSFAHPPSPPVYNWHIY